MIKINIDSKQKDFEKGISPYQILKLEDKNVDIFLSCKVNGEFWDIDRKIYQDCEIEYLSWEDTECKKIFWHSCAHLLAEALRFFFPNCNFGVGPAIDKGFYYDVDFGSENFSNLDFEKVEKKMLELASKNSVYHRIEISKKEAIEFFTKNFDPYKLELLSSLQDGEITLYNQGDFTDLCKGVHLYSTKNIKAVKILNLAGAYWKGDIKNKQLTRIYGISFPSEDLLNSFLENQERLKLNDHRKIGKELKIFDFSEKVGPGLPLWMPNGAILRQRLADFIYKDQIKSGYLPVISPHIAKKELYQISGHYEKYSQDSFQSIKTPCENEEYLLKPMNCPHHCEIYKMQIRSYKDLPLRFFEFGTVYRYEKHGELHGLSRTRSLTQDDGHIFCTKDQIKKEISRTIERTEKIFKILSFKDYYIRVSIRNKNDLSKYIGEIQDWEKAEEDLFDIVENSKIKFEKGEGEAAFYGPKLDFMIKDSMERIWQLGTIQLDYQLPKRFELSYINDENKKETPVLIHRAPIGSFERLISILLEHTEGNLPFWLSPVQITIISICDSVIDYAKKIFHLLLENDFYSEIDNRNEKLSKKIFDSDSKKVPFILIIGEKEKDQNIVSVRKKGSKTNESCFYENLINFFSKQRNFS